MLAKFAPKFKIQCTSRNLSGSPGAALFMQSAEKFGVIRELSKSFQSSGTHRKFREEVHALSIAALLAQGGSAISDIEALRQDRGLLRMLGLPALPAQNTLLDFLHNAPEAKAAAVSREVTRLCVEEIQRRGLSQIILDPDATLVKSGKKSCQWTYKKFRGYAPMVVTEAITRTIFFTEFRAGNQSPGGGALSILETCHKAVPPGVKVKLRSDSAWYQARVLDYCEDNKIDMAIGADKDSAVVSAIEAIPGSGWRPIEDDPQGPEVARTVHTLNEGKHAYTLIVTRVFRDQTDCFEGEYFHRAIITNLSDTPANIVKFYDGRGADEQINDELKNGFSAKDLPTSNHNANGLFWMIAALAYNIVQRLKSLLPAELGSLRIKTIRFRLFSMACLVVEHAGKVTLKIPEKWPWYSLAVQTQQCLSG